jgi:hypothetical protein
MSHLCLGWDIETIREDISFPTEEVYARPNPTEIEEIVNGWWNDLFSYLKKFNGLDVWANSGYMDFFCDEEVYIIGVRVDFGWVLSHNTPDPGDFASGSEIEDFQGIVKFILDQGERGYKLPPPKVHISEWYEHDFNYIETQIEMYRESKEERKKRAERRASSRAANMCDIDYCENKFNNALECLSCYGRYCDEHQTLVHCACGISR